MSYNIVHVYALFCVCISLSIIIIIIRNNDSLLSGRWSDNGCTTHSIEDDIVICSCNHLTNFAILLSPGLEVCPLFGGVPIYCTTLYYNYYTL